MIDCSKNKKHDKCVFETTLMEHKFTSTGIKFWRHVNQMIAYKNKDPNSIISTHISPEGACNLKCEYCSVTYRNTHSHIPIETIQDYIIKLKTRGLKAAILTGGGEPTLYKKFNELVQWLRYDQGLLVALITNGTNSHKVEPKTWNAFSWVRISINLIPNWNTRIFVPTHLLNKDCILGASMVVTDETMKELENCQISELADRLNASYVRILPNCLLDQASLIKMHIKLNNIFEKLKDSRFFHHHKLHASPKCETCHQAYFRPYLSEEPFYKTGKPGTVYPCDSVVLNNALMKFTKKYQICAAENILDFLDRKIQMGFDPRKDCSGCVFTSNVNMLDDWIHDGKNQFDQYSIPLKHEEFV